MFNLTPLALLLQNRRKRKRHCGQKKRRYQDAADTCAASAFSGRTAWLARRSRADRSSLRRSCVTLFCIHAAATTPGALPSLAKHGRRAYIACGPPRARRRRSYASTASVIGLACREPERTLTSAMPVLRHCRPWAASCAAATRSSTGKPRRRAVTWTARVARISLIRAEARALEQAPFERPIQHIAVRAGPLLTPRLRALAEGVGKRVRHNCR